jgi:hypothetical protein
MNCFSFSLSGFSPFAGENIEETIQNVNFVRWDTNEFYDDVTQEAVIFVQQCLKKSPRYRFLDEKKTLIILFYFYLEIA